MAANHDNRTCRAEIVQRLSLIMWKIGRRIGRNGLKSDYYVSAPLYHYYKIRFFKKLMRYKEFSPTYAELSRSKSKKNDFQKNDLRKKKLTFPSISL